MNKLIENIVERLNDRISHYDSRQKILTDAGMFKDSDKMATRISELAFTRDIIQEETKAYNNGWIPCGERLPEEYGEYLCCNKYGKFIVGYPVAKTLGDGFYVETDLGGLDFVVAWQSLPSPYKLNVK